MSYSAVMLSKCDREVVSVLRCGLVLSLAWLIAGASVPPASGQQPENDAQRIERQRLFEQMRRRAKLTLVHRADDATPLELVAEPLVRYSDEPREIVDATFWAFRGKGRPVAFLKVEAYARRESRPAWLYCLGSLDSGLIKAQWGDGHRWSAREPGLKWQVLPDGPSPGESERGRLSQMKALIRRFKIVAQDAARGKEEQRLLARPLYRYNDADEDVVDGAVFGFTTFGTNPAALVLIELQTDEQKRRTWHFAAARFSDAALMMSLDDKQVWSVAAAESGKSELDNWLYFWEANNGLRE